MREQLWGDPGFPGEGGLVHGQAAAKGSLSALGSFLGLRCTARAQAHTGASRIRWLVLGAVFLLGLLVVERTLPALLPQVQRLLTIAFDNMGLILETAHVVR